MTTRPGPTRSLIKDGLLGAVAIALAMASVVIAVGAAQGDSSHLDSNTPNGVSQPPVLKGHY